MTPRQADAATRTSTGLFRERLDNMLNRRHALYRLADLVEWSVFDNEFGSLYCPDNGLLVPAERLSSAGTQLNRKLACLAPLPASIMAA